MQRITQLSYRQGPGASAGLYWKFESTKSQGALLVLKKPAKKLIILPNRSFRRYMRQNYKSWYEFATTTLEVDCQPDDIILVHGCTKASSWTVAAFHGERHSSSFSLSGEIKPFAGVGAEISFIEQRAVHVEKRSGPSRDHNTGLFPEPEVHLFSSITTTGQSNPSGIQPSVPDDRDQCIFLNAYRWKYRFHVYRDLVAKAGPHTLPPPDGPEDADAAQSQELEEQIGTQSGALAVS